MRRPLCGRKSVGEPLAWYSRLSYWGDSTPAATHSCLLLVSTVFGGMHAENEFHPPAFALADETVNWTGGSAGMGKPPAFHILKGKSGA